MEEYDAIGVSVAVVKDKKIIYTKSFGYKDREKSIKLRNKDLFRIASVSKTFVATAILQLVEKGHLSLDDDVNKYLNFNVTNPSFPNVPITIKMLLCHRSSINDSQGWVKTSFDNINPRKNPNYFSCYNDYSPGSVYSYSNLNYELLGAVIENTSGERFDKYIKKHILKPLKTKGSFNSDDLNRRLFVNSYMYNQQTDSLVWYEKTYKSYLEEVFDYTIGYNSSVFSPASGLKITAKDLARYMIMHMNYGTYEMKQIISEKSELLMRQTQPNNNWYALSLCHYSSIIPNEELIGHTGGLFGIYTAMFFHPEKDYGFVVFCNGCKSKYKDGKDLNFKIINTLYRLLI